MPVDATGVEVRYNGPLGTNRPNDVSLSPDGSRIYVAGADGNLRIYNADTGELLQTIDVGIQLGAIDVSPDGSFVIAVERDPLDANFYPEPSIVTVYRIDVATASVWSFQTDTFTNSFRNVSV